VGALLAATDEAVAQFWAVAELPEDGAAPCAELCNATLDLLEAAGRVVPPASDTGCYRRGAEVLCDLDLAPRAIRKMVAKSAGDFAAGKGLSAMAGFDDAAPQPNVSHEEPVPKAASFGYSAEDLAARVAQLFRIYPAAEGVAVDAHLGAASAKAFDAAGDDALVDQRLAQSQAYVNMAIRTFASDGTGAEIAKWFGEQALAKNILSVLNSITNILAHSHVAGGEECDSSTFAYVFPCLDSPLERDSDGRYNLFLCDMFFSVAEEQICTLVHEASHHATACTKDVIYGTRACKMLAKSNPSYALINADNYGYYIREVAWSHGTF